MQQNARAGMNAADSLNDVPGLSRLQDHELPTCRPIVVTGPMNPAEDFSCSKQGCAPAAVRPLHASRPAEAQVDVDATFNESEGNARQRVMAQARIVRSPVEVRIFMTLPKRVVHRPSECL